MSLLSWVRGLRYGTARGDMAPPAPPSRCFGFVDLGRAGVAVKDYRVHFFTRRGQPASPVCLRCKAPNPYLRPAAAPAEIIANAAGIDGQFDATRYTVISTDAETAVTA